MEGSANGYILAIDGHELRAYWPAPFFALVLDDADEPAEPMLFHCETFEDARRKGGTILDKDFNEVRVDVHYPVYCIHPENCAGKTCCPRELSCID